MKSNRNLIATLLTLAFIVAFAGFASAQSHGMMGGMGNMTPEQQATMQKLHADFTAATAGMSKQLFAKESELTAALYADKPDDKKIDALTQEISELNARIYAERVKMRKAMAKEGIMTGNGHGMMGGGMMGGGMKGGGMKGGGMKGGGMYHGQPGEGMQPGAADRMQQNMPGHGAPAQQ